MACVGVKARCVMYRQIPRGFTLVEMIVTFTILAILAMAAMPMGETVVRRTKELELKEALRDVRRAIDRYKQAVDDGRIMPATASGYPATLQVLVKGVPDIKRPGTQLIFLRRVPTDPFCPAPQTSDGCWHLRSYDSSISAPRAGADVYDIMSSSTARSSDGRLYSEW